MAATTRTTAPASRAAISVYWQPGCSSCVKVKEFVAETGLEFESVNVLEHPEALGELASAGIRSFPAVRNGTAFAYAQSMRDVASLLGVPYEHTALPRDTLLQRWDQILRAAEAIIVALDESVLERRVMPQRERTIRELGFHIFQVAEAFLRQVEDDTVDARAIYLDPRPDIATRSDLLTYVDGICREFSAIFLQPGARAIPARLRTHYGLQPSDLVLERGVWHSAQHARQLDVVAAGTGAELTISATLYAGLPMPARLWG